MTTYTTRPSIIWSGYVDILESGQLRAITPENRVDEMIAHFVESTRSHFQHVVDRKLAGDERLVIANGCAYSIGSSSDDPKGFGGQPWLIRFHDGRTVTTVSLWCLGDIPAEWREQLPDNATLKGI